MTSPIHVLARALRMDEQRTEVLTNNIANVATDGFKPERVAQRWFAGADGPTLTAVRDLRQGALQATSNPMDIALEGDGFLVVETPDGDRLTRGGSIQRRAADGILVDQHGSPIRGLVNGVPRQMTAPDGPLTITPDGTIRVRDAVVGQLTSVWPTDLTHLEQRGNGYFETPAPTRPVTDMQYRQGYREASGSDHLTGLVELMDVQRRHAASMEALRALDSMLETGATTIGRIP